MTSNPFEAIIIAVFKDIRFWIYAILGGLAGVRVLMDAAKFKQGDEAERDAAKKSIKVTVYMLVGAFFIVWFIGYLVTKFSGLKA